MRMWAMCATCSGSFLNSSTRSTGSASRTPPTVAGTSSTAGIRSPRPRSATTSATRPAWADWDTRVNSAVTSETVTSECGSMKKRKAWL